MKSYGFAPRRIAWLAATLVLGFSPAAAEPLAERLQAIIEGQEFQQAHWGLLVVDLASGETLYEHQADKLFAPASTTKLFSVAAALSELGADYRFETPVYACGPIDAAGELQGDLVLVASGDLTLGGRTGPDGRIAFTNSDHTYGGFGDTSELTLPDPVAGLRELARQVAAAGIRRVTGDVLIDDRLFDVAEGTGSGPSRITPILVNDNVIDFVITPGEAGGAAQVTWRPQTSCLTVDAKVDTVAAPGSIEITMSSPAPGRIVVRGTIPAGRKPLVRINEVDDPVSFARGVFIEILREAGIDVGASPLGANTSGGLPPRDQYSGLREVARLVSPPFAENARLILKVSHNLHASTLPLLLAARHGERTLADGLHRQRTLLEAAGVPVDTISFGGAAGGDRADYVTPRAAVALLRHMATRPDAAVFREALPILGVDGTLAGSVDESSPARGKVQAKTGTLLWTNTMNDRPLLTSKALAGYGTCASGREVAMAIFVNHVHLRAPTDRERIGRVLGSLCEVICAEL